MQASISKAAKRKSWLDRGLAILADEVKEQILPDGGHFELSPMYHALALEDALDLVNLTRAYPDFLAANGQSAIAMLDERLPAMRHWLATMCHPDGEIAFFNDAAIGIAPSPKELEGYAKRLGLAKAPGDFDAFSLLEDSGYIRVAAGPAVAILDVARVGPDYLPGHAHADTLSFELSVGGRRVLVNSGTSEYGTGPERQRQRGTRAHNTVAVGDTDSSEVWAGFRVGRRARPFGLEYSADGDEICVTCSHDGYARLPGRPVHRRTWRMTPHALTVTDLVTGDGNEGEARFHFHPDLAVTLEESGASGMVQMPGIGPIRFEVESQPGRLEPSHWHPEFGVTLPSQCLVVPLQGGRFAVTFRWNREAG